MKKNELIKIMLTNLGTEQVLIVQLFSGIICYVDSIFHWQIQTSVILRV